MPSERVPIKTLVAIWLSLWALFVGLIAVSPRLSGRDQRYYDALNLYVAGRLLRTGQNPYDADREREESRVVAPDQVPVGISGRQTLIALPGWLPFWAVLSLIPWPAFCCLLTGSSVLCIPCICVLLFRWSPRPLAGPALVLASCVFSAIPCVWQTLVLGQTGLLMTLAALSLLRDGATAAESFLAALALLCKTTLAIFYLPYAAFSLAARRRPLAWAVMVFLLLNGATVARIGWQPFLACYSQNYEGLMAAAGTNNPHSHGKLVRVDLQPLVLAVTRDSFASACYMAGLIGLIAWGAWRLLQARGGKLETASLLALLTLTVVYHRTYDAVLLAPAWFCAAVSARQGVKAVWALAVFFLALTLGHWPVGSSYPEVRNLLLLVALTGMLAMRAEPHVTTVSDTR